jgi:hypothetical protein
MISNKFQNKKPKKKRKKLKKEFKEFKNIFKYNNNYTLL